MAHLASFDDTERRRRLVVRHHLGGTAHGPLQAVRDLVAVHSSDPVTPYLALRARVPGLTVTDVERLLYEERSTWRLHAMRRTLWVVDAAEARVFDAAVGRKVAMGERRRVEGWMAADGVDDPAGWLAALGETVVARVAEVGPVSTRDLADAVPGLDRDVPVNGGTLRLASRLLLLLAMDGDVVRGRPMGTWRGSQYRWVTPEDWFGTTWEEMEGRPARARLLRRWLAAFGPALETDLRWYTKWTVAEARQALEDVGAVPVEVRTATEVVEGVVLPDDLEPTPEPPTTVALLPGLDPTVMGWKERSWFVGDHEAQVFDRNGNAGPVVVVDGRVVGAWGTDRAGRVRTELYEEVDESMVETEATRLTSWLDGTPVTPRFPTPSSRRLTG